MQTEPPENTTPDPVVGAITTTTPTSITSPEARAPGYWAVLRNRNYALLFWGYLISSAGTQMQIVAVSWQVYELTHSAVALGVIGLLQAIPRLLFSLVGG